MLGFFVNMFIVLIFLFLRFIWYMFLIWILVVSKKLLVIGVKKRCFLKIFKGEMFGLNNGF